MNDVIEIEVCVRCDGDDICAYDGHQFICWDCADAIKFNTAFVPADNQFAIFKK